MHAARWGRLKSGDVSESFESNVRPAADRTSPQNDGQRKFLPEREMQEKCSGTVRNWKHDAVERKMWSIMWEGTQCSKYFEIVDEAFNIEGCVEELNILLHK